MKNDFKSTLSIFSIIGILIFIKGFQDNLGILDISTIFVIFICFSMGFVLLTVSMTNFLFWISNFLFKKYRKKN